jgi:tetratricopeptide (TPR) repeat protein
MQYLGAMEVTVGRVEDAEPLLVESTGGGTSENAARAMLHLGRLNLLLERRDDARAWFTKASTTGQGRLVPYALINLGKIEIEDGEYLEARRHLQAAVRSGHRDIAPAAMNRMAELEMNIYRDLDAAQQWLEAAVGCSTDATLPVSLRALGDLATQRGDLPEARSLYLEAIRAGDGTDDTSASRRLEELERRELDQRQANWFVQFGDPSRLD